MEIVTFVDFCGLPMSPSSYAGDHFSKVLFPGFSFQHLIPTPASKHFKVPILSTASNLCPRGQGVSGHHCGVSFPNESFSQKFYDSWTSCFGQLLETDFQEFPISQSRCESYVLQWYLGKQEKARTNPHLLSTLTTRSYIHYITLYNTIWHVCIYIYITIKLYITLTTRSSQNSAKAHGTQHRQILLRLRTGEARKGEGFVDAWQMWTRQTGAVQGGHGHLSWEVVENQAFPWKIDWNILEHLGGLYGIVHFRV